MSVQNRNGLSFDDIWDSNRDGKLDFHEESYMNYMEQEWEREEHERRFPEEEESFDDYDSGSCFDSCDGDW